MGGNGNGGVSGSGYGYWNGHGYGYGGQRWVRATCIPPFFFRKSALFCDRDGKLEREIAFVGFVDCLGEEKGRMGGVCGLGAGGGDGDGGERRGGRRGKGWGLGGGEGEERLLRCGGGDGGRKERV